MKKSLTYDIKYEFQGIAFNDIDFNNKIGDKIQLLSFQRIVLFCIHHYDIVSWFLKIFFYHGTLYFVGTVD